MKRNIFLFVLLSCILLFSAHADIIQGTVTDDADQSPLSQVKVSLDGNPNCLVYTGSDGTYRLDTDQTGIKEAPLITWNPSAHVFSLRSRKEKVTIRVMNAKGICIHSNHRMKARSGIILNLAEYPCGLYFVSIEIDKEQYLYKILKMGRWSSYAIIKKLHQPGTNRLHATARIAANVLTFTKYDYQPGSLSLPDGDQTGADIALKLEPVAILDNGILTVQFDRSTERVTVLSKSGGNTFLENGTLNRTDGTAKIVARNHATFGTGQAIEVSYSGGHKNWIMLFPNNPFAMFQTAVNNSGNSDLLQRKVATLNAQCNLGTSNIKTMGTRRLDNAAQRSYSYLAVVNPSNRNGVVFGWMTHDRGNGVVFSSALSNSRVPIEARIEYGTLYIPAGDFEEMEILGVGYFDDARFGLESWADEVAKVYDIKLRPQPSGFCTWYSDQCGRGGDQDCVAELADWISTNTNLQDFGMTFIQIDDYWQEGIRTWGPAKNFTTHRTTNDVRYANGMKSIADEIRGNGFTAGIWFMPFSANKDDPIFQPHQDWMVRGVNGDFLLNHWSGQALDMSVDGACTHLTTYVSRMSKEWGFKYFKMDGIYHGAATDHLYEWNSQQSNDYKDDFEDAATNRPAQFSNKYVTPIEAHRKGCRLIREAAGDDVYFLGCTLVMNYRSISGCVGLVDAMRVGHDNSPDWNSVIKGANYGTKLYFFNNRFWVNDPDPVYLRNSCAMEQVISIASWIGVTGQLAVFSDWLPDVSSDRINVYKRIIPAHGLKKARPVDYFDVSVPNVWLLTDDTKEPRRDVILGINWDGSNGYMQSFTLDKIGLPAGTYVGYDFWEEKFLAPFSGSINFAIAPKSCKVLAVRKTATVPQVVSTNRHVTQGIISITEEKWDAGTNTLSGTSNVVRNDPYELRIVAMNASGNWTVQSASVSSEDQSAGVTVDPPNQDQANVRVTIKSPQNRSVKWSIGFN